MINWQLSKQGIRWPVSPERIAGSGVDPSRSSIFWSYPLTIYSFSNDRRLTFTFVLNSQQICCVRSRAIGSWLCLCQNRPALLRFWFQTDLRRRNSASFLKIQAGKTFSYHGHALVTLYVQFLCSDWSKFDRWVHAENLCSILNLVYFDSWSWQSFLSTCDVFNCLFPLDVQNEIQLLSGVFCYSWLVCLLGFWLRNTSLVKVGNPISDGIVFVFHLAWCVRGLKSLKRFWPYLIVFSASRMVSLSNYCIWCLFFTSNLMKSSVVYAAIWFMHVCKIWDNDLTEYQVWL